MNHRARQHPAKEFLSRTLGKYPQLVVYACIIGVFFFSLYLDNRNQRQDRETSCQAAIDSRNVDRDQTQRIYTLAMSFVPSKAEIKKLPPEDRARTAAYISQVKTFRRESFKTIKPSEVCAPYVDDENVTPEQWEKEHPPKPLNES